MKPLTTVLLLSLVIFTGCQHNPYVMDYTSERPQPADLSGTYNFEKQTVIDSPFEKAPYKSYILLKDDGSFVANDIPNVFGDHDEKFAGPISSAGQWDIDTVGSFENIWGQTKPHVGIKLTNMPESLASIGLIGSAPPYKLIVTFDDPSLEKIMIFSKKQP
jgi:hypothetical protein